jgi:hypothetical protein
LMSAIHSFHRLLSWIRHADYTKLVKSSQVQDGECTAKHVVDATSDEFTSIKD